MSVTKRLLERGGYNVRCAEGIADARQCLENFKPAGVVLNRELPDGDGLDFCGELHRSGVTPILFLSREAGDAIRAFSAGAGDFIKKPYDTELLKARLGIMLAGKDPEQETSGVVVFSSKKRGSNRTPEERAARRFQISFAACLTIAVLSVAAFFAVNNGGGDETDIPDTRIPLAEVPSEQPPEIQFPRIDGETLDLDAPVQLHNPADNDCYLAFEITLCGERQPLFTSGLIAPGEHVTYIAPRTLLPRGEYGATVRIRAYALDTEPIAAGEAEVTLAVT